MFAFIARQPILDREKDVFGYELLFRDGKSGAYPSHDADKARYIAEHFHTLGLDDICGEKTSFINFQSLWLRFNRCGWKPNFRFHE